MLALSFILPLAAALACLGLNRAVPTRWCAGVAAAALALAALALALAQRDTTLFGITWATLADGPLRLEPGLEALTRPLGVGALAGGALALAGLALALPQDVRGFAGLPAALALTILATLCGLATRDAILTPALWMLAALAASATLRASGALPGSDAPLIVSLAGSFATLLLLAAGLLGGTPGLVCTVVAVLLALGTAPFNAVAGAYGQAPAGLGGALMAFGPPLLGATTLLRAAEAGFSPVWKTALTLLGGLALLACAAGALGEQRGRRLVAWQHGAQSGLLLVAAAQGGAALAAAPWLLLGSAAATLTAGLAIAALERRAGTDDLGAAELQQPLAMPGLALLIAGAAAVGAPGTWSFWLRAPIYTSLSAGALGWLAGPLLAGTGLLALSYLAPLATLWRGTQASPDARAGLQPIAMIALLAGAPLLVLGAYPQLAGAAPFSRSATAAGIVAALSIALLPLVLLGRIARAAPASSDERPTGAVLPTALAESVAGLAWIGAPSAALNMAWEGLLGLSQLLAQALLRFEQRYYMAGLMIALIIMILFFI
jgi:multicomponent Na+:H+ antiporter subunit A